MKGSTPSSLVAVTETADGRIRIGDTVRTTQHALAQGIERTTFVVKAIQRDWFGDLLLSEPGGYGLGAQYCELTNP